VGAPAVPLSRTRQRHRNVEPPRICRGPAALRKEWLQKSCGHCRFLQARRQPGDLHQICRDAAPHAMTVSPQSLAIAIIYNLVADRDRVDVNSIIDGVASIQAALET